MPDKITGKHPPINIYKIQSHAVLLEDGVAFDT